MAEKKQDDRFVICINNEGYPASLELCKVYRVIPDSVAGSRGFLRVVDESGEDFLYPQGAFVPIEVPQSAKQVFAHAS